MRIISIKRLNDDRKKPWRVRYEDESGQKVKHFQYEEDARGWSSKHCPELVAPSGITEEERMLISLVRMRCDREEIDIQDAVSTFLNEAKPRSSATLQFALDNYVDDMERRQLRRPYRENAEYVIRRFILDKESWPVSGIQPSDVVQYCLLCANGSVNQTTIRSRIITFLNWAKDQGWTDIDTSKIKWRAVKTDRKKIGFYTPEMVEAFLGKMPDKLKFPMALLFLTGIRPKGEFMKLRYEHINPRRKVIEIPEDVSKTRTHRTLYDLPEVLWEWYALAKPKRGRVCPMTYRNLRTHIQRARESLGYGWPQDCTRHTFATCAFHVGLEWALDIMGHTDSKLFLKSYKGQIDPKDAGGLWRISPRVNTQKG